MNVEHNIEFLLKKTAQLHKESMEYRDYIDTVSSPIYKRLWWHIGGYHFRKVGRWYSDKSRAYRIWYKIAKFIHCT